MSVVEQIQTELRKILPKEVPGVAYGVVQALGIGWFKVLYYDPVTGARVTFAQPPSLVAIAEVRGGTPPKVTAPRISIPTMSLPSAPSISVPAVEIPKTATIEIPEVSISYLNESFPYFVATVDWAKPWAVSLNAQTRSLYTLQSRANDVIWAITLGLKKAREAAIAIRDSLLDFRDRVQVALNDYKDKIQVAVNSGFADARTKTQEALNAYRDNIQASVNAGLDAMIPKLYEMIGMPIDQLMSPINIRNVTTESFEFYSLSAGMKLHYMAIGKR